MQKIERNFLIITIILISLIIWIAIHSAFFKREIDRNSYVELINGSALLNNNELQINKREKISAEDIITTSSEDALAIIEWWEWSVTRIWGNSKVKVSELYVSENKDKINISFELLDWKTWSNVVSFIPDDSFFIQRFMDAEAAVRGTIFNVDLVNKYIYVIENKVEVIKNTWESILVEETKPLDLRTFSFIKLEEFIKSIKDTAFESMNRVLDSEFYKKMQDSLEEKSQELIDYTTKTVDYMTDLERNEFYLRLLASYQDVNFLWNDAREDLYEYKIKLKEKLIEYAPAKDKQILLEWYVEDFKDSINIKNNDLINWMLESFKRNKNDLSATMQETIGKYSFEIPLPEWLKEAFQQNINDIKSWFNK